MSPIGLGAGGVAIHHQATIKPKRSKKAQRVEIEVTCSCGAGQVFVVTPCEGGERCCATRHVRAAPVLDVKEGARGCPALVAVLRSCDDSYTRARAEEVLRDGL